LGFMIMVILEPQIRLGAVSADTRGLAPLWGGMGHSCRGLVIREPLP